MIVYNLLESERKAIEEALLYHMDPVDGDEMVEAALEIIMGLKKQNITVEELLDGGC